MLDLLFDIKNEKESENTIIDEGDIEIENKDFILKDIYYFFLHLIYIKFLSQIVINAHIIF